jgi:hypothetical protein
VGNFIKIDRRTRTWCCPELDKKNPDLFSFSDLLDYELSEDGISVTKGGLGSAVVGGLVFGGVGAIVGGGLGKKQKDIVNSMAVRVTVRNDFISTIEIPLIKTETKKGGLIYKGIKDIGNQIVSLLNVVSDAVQAETGVQVPVSPTGSSMADELLKLKSLLDAGALTQEEYGTAKSRVLKEA